MTGLGAGAYIIPNDSNHGIAFKIRTERFYRTRAGRRAVYRITKIITKISRY